MKKNENNKKKSLLNIVNIYENDYKLMKIITQTKEMRHNNYSLTERKNNLKNLMIKINDEIEINNNEIGKDLRTSNENFHNEYKIFNKRKRKKDTKTIFKDLVKLYKSRGYRIPNFSINEHNIFKINPLLEDNATTISNGFLTNQLLKKNNASEKIICYLKKLGSILSEKLSNDEFSKNFNKIKITNLKLINEEDSVEALKKQIEIITNLIKTNALDKLDEPKKVNYKSYSRQNSLKSNKFRSSKKLLYLNKERHLPKKNSKTLNKKLNNDLNERRVSTESSLTNRSIMSNIKKGTGLEKSSNNVYKLLNFNNINPGINSSKTPKDLKIPTLNLQTINQINYDNNNSNNIITPTKPRFSSEKLNNLLINELITTPKNNKDLNWNRNTIKDIKKNLISVDKRRLSTFKNISNIESSLSDDNLESNIPTSTKNKNINSYPYTNRNEFINYAYMKFSRKGFSNCENYIKKYLNKVKGFNDDKVEEFFKSIYDKNMKDNLKEIESQIAENNIYLKTERLYLSNHLIKRIKPTLKNMNENDKIILKLEKIFTRSVISK